MAKKKSREQFAKWIVAKFRRYPCELFAVLVNYCDARDTAAVIKTGISIGIIPEDGEAIFWMNLQDEHIVDLIIDVSKHAHCLAESSFSIVNEQVKIFDAHPRYRRRVSKKNLIDEPVQIKPGQPSLALTILVGNKEVSKLDPQILEAAARLLGIKLPS
ncbi:hypothetical protein ACFL24_02590 [Patescibacteria group bacterium]